MSWFNETLIYLICKLLVVEQKSDDFVIHKVLWMAIEESITWVYDALQSLLTFTEFTECIVRYHISVPKPATLLSYDGVQRVNNQNH